MLSVDLLTKSLSAEPSMLDWNGTYRLSRFAFIRAADDGFFLETALSNQQFRVRHISLMHLLATLSRPIAFNPLLSSIQESRRGIVHTFLTRYDEAQLMTQMRSDCPAEDDV